ncbi:uncharacterized protein N7477_007131 [Penicillium maclennaniae]|uniref:uncharacterized protein n=1 Tax=Penicillium maclennaniae TaxID=1343394 RepID=UPI0025423CE4|nr:uncharacterized protein N7477_007131 [Penicillium maclennaniae]KAJ5668561.1 hypothetical protein N7477_007131 [Penicillium maclennaniae]
MPPPNQQPSKPMRILDPYEAKRLSKKPATANTGPELQKYPSLAAHTTAGPSLVRKRFLPTFISSIRERYAALPTPVRRTCRALRIFGTLVPIGLFFSEHVARLMWVRGPSMTPYLNEDYEQTQTKSDMILVSMWPYGATWPWQRQIKRRLERGMVVTFRSPANSSHVAIKRVVGLPGDRITTREPCMKRTQIVPFNHVWLEGDAEDPKRTLDSNTYGPVSISLITGRVVGVISPRFRWLKWQDWEAGKLDDEENYRQNVRDRVLKEAVRMEEPAFE